MARHEYERCLGKLNLTIEAFETSYKPILNRIQEGDEAQIRFVKFSLEKLARYVEDMGKDLRQRGDDIGATLGMVNGETDVKIFIDSNRSQNHFLQKEAFQEFEQAPGRRSTRSSQEVTFEITQRLTQIECSVIDEDYI